MASINFNEIKVRFEGLSRAQLIKIRDMAHDRIQALQHGAEIKPYDPNWAKSPPIPKPSFNKPPSKKAFQPMVEIEDDDDVPF